MAQSIAFAASHVARPTCHSSNVDQSVVSVGLFLVPVVLYESMRLVALLVFKGILPLEHLKVKVAAGISVSNQVVHREKKLSLGGVEVPKKALSKIS